MAPTHWQVSNFNYREQMTARTANSDAPRNAQNGMLCTLRACQFITTATQHASRARPNVAAGAPDHCASPARRNGPAELGQMLHSPAVSPAHCSRLR